MIATYAIFIDDVFASVESCIASVMIMTRRRRQIIVCFCPSFTLSTSLYRTLDIVFSFLSLSLSLSLSYKETDQRVPSIVADVSIDND